METSRHEMNDEIICVLHKLKRKLTDENYCLKNDVHYKREHYSNNNCSIENNTLLIERIDRIMHTVCNHKWIDDDVDISCERSMSITYCENCELTK